MQVKETLPINMRTMVLPNLKEFETFPAAGPGGQALADINGCAASIERYLDLHAPGMPAPLVRWTNYKEDVGTYQGALQAKDRYSRHSTTTPGATARMIRPSCLAFSTPSSMFVQQWPGTCAWMAANNETTVLDRVYGEKPIDWAGGHDLKKMNERRAA
jgi:hypothetical protein